MKKQWQKPNLRVYLLCFLPLVAGLLFHSLLLTPLYLTLISDSEWNATALPSILGYLQLLLQYSFFWFAFAFLCRTAGKWHPAAIILPLAGACLFRQTLELVVGYAVMGFPTWAEFREEELTFTLLQLLFDGLLIAAALPVIFLVKRKRTSAILLAALPVLFQVISLVIVLAGYGGFTKELLIEAALDLIVHIVCLAGGYGVILLWDRFTGKGETT